MFAARNRFTGAFLSLCITGFAAVIPIRGASPIIVSVPKPENTIPPGRITPVFGTTTSNLTNLTVYFGDQKIGETIAYGPQYYFGLFITNDIPGDYQLTLRGTNETGALVSSDPFTIHYPERAAARFMFPTNGANLFFGEDIKIQVEPILDRGHLTAMSIYYPDALGMYFFDESPPYELVWRPRTPGTYTFYASPWFDSFGYGESTERLTFDILPESVAYITDQPGYYRSLEPGHRFQLSVASVSRGPQRYQWLHNSIPIPGATNATYTVETATAADSGLYSVTIDNFAGRTSSEAVRVELVAQVGGGGTVLFSNIGLENDPRVIDVAKTGFLDVKLLAGPALDRMILYRKFPAVADGQFDGGVITLSNVPPGGKAFVQVVAERYWETFVGASRILEITAGGEQPARLTGLESFETGSNYFYLFLPFLRVDASPSTNIYAGFDVELMPSSSYPELRYLTNVSFQWNKNGLPIPGATNEMLRLKNVQINDAAWYSVLATDWTRIGEAGVGIAVLHPLSVTATDDGSLKLRTNPGARYTLETSGDLNAWTFWKTIVADSEELTLPVLPSTSGQIFYRAVAEP
jgi:hypothetical protein